MTILNRAKIRTTDLKIKPAIENLIGFPFYTVGWLVGKVWLILKLTVAIIVVGFEEAQQ